MKVSERWLRTWCDPRASTEEIAQRLTLLGLEVDDVEQASVEFEGVVVARIDAIEPHPDADRLRVCTVDAGDATPLTVVCGAPNARVGLVTALAMVGGRLPDGTILKKARLRGVASEGMLCSVTELALSEEGDGILELDDSAVPGTPLQVHLDLDDAIIDVDLTPDRSDCLSIRGIARELSAKTGVPLHDPAGSVDVVVDSSRTHDVVVEADTACVRFAGRVIDGVDLSRTTPTWLTERLRRAGVRAINPAVDVTNYVMLERGHPMHAFDLDRLQGAIRVRQARRDEPLKLLDGRQVILDTGTTVIADDRGAIGIAGIMGGDSTAVSEASRSVFLECALFLPERIAGLPRRYASQSESSHRFERGVDPAGQRDALDHATRLLIAISGGRAGPASDWIDKARQPARLPVPLRRERMARLLGTRVPDSEVERILAALGIDCEATDGGWRCTPPSWRYDLSIEEDFIEEIGRVHGFENIPRRMPAHVPTLAVSPETRVQPLAIKERLVARGYQEVVTYSFVDAATQSALRPELAATALANPISSDLAVMRTTLVGGLLDVVARNRSRQVAGLRVFETGLRFLPGGASADAMIDPTLGDDLQVDASLRQQSMLAGAATGPRNAENWNADGAAIDFFDVKRDLEALFARANGKCPEYRTSSLAMLHPARQASVSIDGRAVGYLGEIEPSLQGSLELGGSTWVFELALAALQCARLPVATPLSRYPQVRRDLALLVEEAVSHDALRTTIERHSPASLVRTVTFDVYAGPGVPGGCKSIGIGLILQDVSRTLADAEVDEAMARLVKALGDELGAVLRT